jgi:hypothetical protein
MQFLEPGSPLHYPRVVGLRYMALSLAQSAMARRYLAERGLARNRVSPTRRSVIPPTTGGVCSMPAHSALWEALARPTSKGAGHSEEATTTRGLDGHP